jgi:hypothetical protein
MHVLPLYTTGNNGSFANTNLPYLSDYTVPKLRWTHTHTTWGYQDDVCTPEWNHRFAIKPTHTHTHTHTHTRARARTVTFQTWKTPNYHVTRYTYYGFAQYRAQKLGVPVSKASYYTKVHTGLPNTCRNMPNHSVDETPQKPQRGSTWVLSGCFPFIWQKAVFCIHVIIMYLHRAGWNYSATVTEGFPCFFLSCKVNAKV